MSSPETRFAAVSCNASPITNVNIVADATIAVTSIFIWSRAMRIAASQARSLETLTVIVFSVDKSRDVFSSID